MSTNTSALKLFAQQTRAKLVSLVSTKLKFLLGADTAELRGYDAQIRKLRSEIATKGEKEVIEGVAYTWFNRVMALRYMDANGYNSPKVVTPLEGQLRPEILQDAMAGSIDEDLRLSQDDVQLSEPKLYRKLLVAVCNNVMSVPMPFLFEHLTDYTELLLPDDLLSEQSFVTDIRKGMTDEDCQNVEIMGWLYQFYITDRKADAEAKKSKKGGLKSDEQAAATQLFTPHWIVRYMVENSLGRIWMTLHPESALVNDMPYYIATPEGQTDTIPEDIHSVQDIRFIDPCMGSGHILVYAFDLFCKMYEEEGQLHKDIPTLILQNNIYGIDIDRRCYQLASFALTMKAREYYSRYLRHTVNPNVIALENIDRDTIDSAGSWGQKSLMWQFEHIDTIGSLLKVTPEECAAIHVDGGLFGERQQLMKTQAEYLSRKYHCVVTNPPYLGKGMGDSVKSFVQNIYPSSKADLYAAFIDRLANMPCAFGFSALVTMESWMFQPSFIELRKQLLNNISIINLSHFDWHIMRIAFGTVSFVLQNRKNGNKDRSVFSYLSRNDVDFDIEKPFKFPVKDNGRFSIKNQTEFLLIPGSIIGYWGTEKMIEKYKESHFGDFVVPRHGLATSDNNRFLKAWFEVSLSKSSLKEKCDPQKKWYPMNKGGAFRKWYGNNEWVINYENDGSEIKEYAISLYKCSSRTIQNTQFYFKKCITWSALGAGPLSIRWSDKGAIFGSGAHAAFADDSEMVYALGFMNSAVSLAYLKFVSPTFNTNVDDLRNIPYLNNHKNTINLLVEQNILISRHDWNSHENSWDFNRNPLYDQFLECMYDDLQNTIPAEASLDNILQYDVPEAKHPLSTCMHNYKDAWEVNFMRLHDNEEELNRQFIEIYGLQDELTPDVPLDEITILQKGEISIEDNHIVWHDDVIIKQFISWLIGCFMGRYSPYAPGLIIASQGEGVEDYVRKVSEYRSQKNILQGSPLKGELEGAWALDDDGIIPVIQEPDFFTDDMTQRIEAAVKTLFGEQHFYENMKYIKQCLGMELRDYLYKNFYADHQQMYSVKGAKRPIYWMFSSQMGDKKKKGYFKALVYMHRMEADTLSKLHADYVHPYLQKIEQQQIEAEDNASRDDLSQAQRNKALKLADEIRDKVREVKAFETALVEMASARITIDLDDGVKANYPKFYPLVEPIKGLDKAEGMP